MQSGHSVTTQLDINLKHGQQSLKTEPSAREARAFEKKPVHPHLLLEAESEATDTEEEIPRDETHMVEWAETVVTLDDITAVMNGKKMPNPSRENSAPARPI